MTFLQPSAGQAQSPCTGQYRILSCLLSLTTLPLPKTHSVPIESPWGSHLRGPLLTLESFSHRIMLQCLLGSGYIFEFSAHSQMRLDLVSCGMLSALGASGVDITTQPTCLASFNTAHKITPLVPCHSGGQVLEDGCVTDHEGAGQSWETEKRQSYFPFAD